MLIPAVISGVAPGLGDEQELGVFVGKIKNFSREKGFGDWAREDIFI